jgi:cytidylate kinase
MSTSIIAIDGPAGSGKSTVAKALAERLNWSFLDTGAMYRAVTAEVLDKGISVEDGDAIAIIAGIANIETLPKVTINGRDVSEIIRTPLINENVSAIAAISQVREHMVKRQREFAELQPLGTVVEGRDITTVVFPDATLKVYLDADVAERAKRRGNEDATAIINRDTADSTRTVSPLRQADDAIFMDTSDLSVSEVVEAIVKCLP